MNNIEGLMNKLGAVHRIKMSVIRAIPIIQAHKSRLVAGPERGSCIGSVAPLFRPKI
jgi:hypothetical protein